MAVDNIQLPPDSTGKKVAARSYTEGAQTVYSQAGYLTTDTAAGNPAAVQNTVPTGSEYGLVTRSFIQGATFASQSPTALTASGQVSAATGLGNAGHVTLVVSGTYGFTTTPPTYVLEASANAGTTWTLITAVREDTGTQESGGTLPANGIRSWNIAMGGYDQVRLRLTAWGTPTGSIVTLWTPAGTYYEPSFSWIPAVGSFTRYSCVITNDTMTVTDAVRTNLISTRDYVAAAAVSTVPVTAGKRMRLTSWSMVVKAPSTTAVGGMYTLRVNPTGAAVVGSPAVAVIATGLVGTQVAQNAAANSATFPDGGIDLTPGMQFTVSGQGIASAGYYLSIQGYEY